MSRRSLLPILFVAVGCHVRPESLVPAGVSAHAADESEFLRGKPATFVVVGDEASYGWPVLLQGLLDAHAQERGLYQVVNCASDAGTARRASGTAPLEAQAQTSLSILAASSAASAPGPRTALCMVSLRGIGDERGPVKSENDMVGAEMGADALERLALDLRAAGIERVVFATPLYAAGAEPELGLERVAIERLISRGHPFIQAGPDVFTASRRYFPDAFAPDRLHPNEFGTKLVAEEWYRWLAGPQAHEAAVEELYSTDYDVEGIEAAHAGRSAPPR